MRNAMTDILGNDGSILLGLVLFGPDIIVPTNWSKDYE